MKPRVLAVVVSAITSMIGNLSPSAAAGNVGESVPSPVRLVDHHVDLRVRYDALGTNLLDLVAIDDDLQPPRAWAAEDCILMVPEASRLDLPDDVPPLGRAGEPIWILPASQQADLLYLGLSAEGVPAGIFEDLFRLRLVGVDGPGSFFLWQSDLGGLRFFMNTRDGVGDADVFRQLVGGHSHANWGFTTSGVYRVTLQVENRRVGESTNVLSPPRTFVFHVLPLPASPESPFLAWQREQWPSASDAPSAAPGADPDGDGQPNLWEYLLGTDPKSPDLHAERSPRIGWIRAGGVPALELRVAKRATCVDVGFRTWWAPSLHGPWTEQSGAWQTEADVDGWTPLRLVLPPEDAGASRRFLRVEAFLVPAW